MICTVDQVNSVSMEGYHSKKYDPQVGKASRDHQRTQALGIGQMTFMEVKSAAFLVQEKGFNAKAFFCTNSTPHREDRNW